MNYRKQKLLDSYVSHYTTNGRHDGHVEPGVEVEKVRDFFSDFIALSGDRLNRMTHQQFRSLIPENLFDHYQICSDALFSAPYLAREEVEKALAATGYKYEILDFHVWNAQVTPFVVYYGKNDPRYKLQRKYRRDWGWIFHLVNTEDNFRLVLNVRNSDRQAIFLGDEIEAFNVGRIKAMRYEQEHVIVELKDARPRAFWYSRKDLLEFLHEFDVICGPILKTQEK